MLLQGLLPVHRRFTGHCFNLGPIHHHSPQLDQPLLLQHRQQLCKQPVQGFLILHSKTRQGVIVDAPHSRQPLIHGMIIAAPRHLAGRTDPLAVGIHPHTNQQAGIQCVLPGRPFNGFDMAIETAQIQPPQQFPNGTGGMVLFQQVFGGNRAPFRLCPLDGLEPRKAGWFRPRRLTRGWLCSNFHLHQGQLRLRRCLSHGVFPSPMSRTSSVPSV